MKQRTEFLITAWLPDTEGKFLSQYGMVTNRQWLELEQRRIPNSGITEQGNMLALVQKK